MTVKGNLDRSAHKNPHEWMHVSGGVLPSFAYPIVLEYLSSDMLGRYKAKPILNDDGRMTGIKINLKKPARVKPIADNTGVYLPTDVVISNLGKADEEADDEDDIRIDIGSEILSSFGISEEEDINEYRCELEGNWLKIYLVGAETIGRPEHGYVGTRTE